MDNKITKKRLSNFLSYDWILMLAIALVGILVFELLYTFTGVRLTTGQQFKIFYDQNFSTSNNGMSKLSKMIKDKNALSYDVLATDYEVVVAGTDIMSVRLSIEEGDVVITDNRKPDDKATDKTVRSESVVDRFSVYTLENLVADAKAYLMQFMADNVSGTEVNYENLDTNKIDQHFLSRMKKDNRFRTAEQKEQGKLLERNRIKTLCRDLADFEYFLNNAPEDCFYRYTKYKAIKETAEGETKTTYEKLYQEQIDKGLDNAVYGINLGALVPADGETSADEFFKLGGEDTAKDTVLMVFNFLDAQEDLQFETISFACAILRECSNVI